MKRIINTGIIFSLCAVSLMAKAQQQKKEKQSELQKKSIVKINLPALAFKNISVQYERAIGKRTSLAANVRLIPIGKLPFQSTFKDITDNTDIRYDQFQLGSFGVVPEFRYYVGRKGVLHGFYIGPFINYSNYKLSVPIDYPSSTGTKTGLFDGKMTAITGGLQFGTQFSLGKNMVLDWWIVGPNYGSANGTLTFTGTLSQYEQDELKKKLEQVKNDVPFEAIKSYNVSSTGANIVAKGPWGGLRGMGFSLGIRL